MGFHAFFFSYASAQVLPLAVLFIVVAPAAADLPVRTAQPLRWAFCGFCMGSDDKVPKKNHPCQDIGKPTPFSHNICERQKWVYLQ